MRNRYVWSVCWSLAIATLVVGVLGCTQGPSLAPNQGLLSERFSPIYSNEDWEVVLRDYVRYGLVDYDSLKKNREVLDRYYALLSVTGPVSTPDQFPSSAHATAYYINAFNALVLEAVLSRYPVSTMYDLNMPRLAHGYQFMVDGQEMNLAAIEEKMLEASGDDVRVLLATSRAAMGTPRLANEPIRPASLERQLAEAAADVLENPDLCRIDHTSRTIYIWQLILRYDDEFVEYWKTRRRVRAGYLFNVLLELASPQRRRAMQSAVGYAIQQMPFDRTLNRWSAETQRPVVP